VAAAQTWWVATLGLPEDQCRRPTLKHHQPATLRRNIGDTYHGCLTVTVAKSRELYWTIDGLVEGIVGGCDIGSDEGNDTRYA
jgi:hypothetical protein